MTNFVILSATSSILNIAEYIIYFNPNATAAWGDIEVYIFWAIVELSELSTKSNIINWIAAVKIPTIKPVCVDENKLWTQKAWKVNVIPNKTKRENPKPILKLGKVYLSSKQLHIPIIMYKIR